MRSLTPETAVAGGATISLASGFVPAVAQRARDGIARRTKAESFSAPIASLEVAIASRDAARDLIAALEREAGAIATAIKALMGEEYRASPHPLVAEAELLSSYAAALRKIEPGAQFAETAEPVEILRQTGDRIAADIEAARTRLEKANALLPIVAVIAAASPGVDFGGVSAISSRPISRARFPIAESRMATLGETRRTSPPPARSGAFPGNSRSSAARRPPPPGNRGKSPRPVRRRKPPSAPAPGSRRQTHDPSRKSPPRA